MTTLSKSGRPQQDVYRRVLTVVAKDPRSEPGAAPNDAALKAIWDKLPQKDETHEVREAPHVERLARILKEVSKRRDDEQPDLIQIIGHGQPGMLSLGYHWTRQGKDTRGLTYVLDSDPDVYGVLDKPIKPDAHVWLLGCAVGDDEDDRLHPLIADGATFIFALAQMWECTVGAPIDPISVDDFDDKGIFATKSRLQTVKGYRFDPFNWLAPPQGPAPAAPERRTPAKNGATKPLVVFKRLIGTARESVEVKNDENHALQAALGDEVQRSPVLAVPDLVFEATCDRQKVSAELIGNGRLLRLRSRDGTTRHVTVDQSQARNVVCPMLERVTPPSRPWQHRRRRI
jgi:hypothetical protein